MTQTTDQERAEFEAWWQEWGLGDYETQFEAWQAARRAQVVPQGWKLVPEDSTEEWLAALRENGVRIGSFESLLTDVLAAAPQPPTCNPSLQPLPELATKAAPVQMPESISKVLEDCHSRAIDYATCASPYNNTRMETAFQYLEHQVRQLLALHGIK